MAEVETRYGILTVPETERDIIGRFLARFGEWAWDEARFVASTLPADGARVLDVGAYLGTFGLGVALQRRLGFLCFVEANSNVAPVLADNIRRNYTAPAQVLDALVGGPGLQLCDGAYVDGNIGSMSFLGEYGRKDGNTASKPPHQLVTLSALRAEHGLFDLVKLDVEGMELDILRSDAKYLARGDTSIWVECNEDPRSLAVVELLLSWGLDLYYFAFPAHNPDNLRGDPVPIFPFAYEAGLLAAPRLTPALDDELRAHHCVLRPVRSVEEAKMALWRTPRWGAPEWVSAGVEEVVALAGRQLRGECYATFLGPDWCAKGLEGEGLRARLHATEEGLRTAETLAFERLALLATERERAEDAEARLARASALALDRLYDLGATRERAAQAEAGRKELEARATAAEIRATAVETSTFWRLTAPLRRFVGTRPRLHGMLRQLKGMRHGRQR